MLPAYAELNALTHFSFQRGASSPDEMVARAQALGYRALAITDECSMAGVVRAHLAAQGTGLQLLIGTELRIEAPELACGGFTLVLLARHREGYGQLCELITAARGREQRGRERYRLHWRQPPLSDAPLGDVLALLLPWRELPGDAHREPHGSRPADIDAAARWLAQRFAGRAWLGVALLRRLDDGLWLARLRAVAQATGLPLVAAGGALMHVRSRKPVLDVMTAIREHRPVADCGFALAPHAEAHLRSRLSLSVLYPSELLAETQRVADACRFELSELRYEYPHELVPAGQTPTSHLRRLTLLGAAERYPQGVPAPVMAQIDKELGLISELRYEPYFLTVHDVVAFAREQKILCQGRGSAANSAVCYCLGITEVNPAQSTLLFERFISKERNEPPDIDVDFEHQRREEVIQYLYTKYGRHRAALAAAVATYHPRSAIRDVGKALGLAPDLVDTLAKSQQWWDGAELLHERLIEIGLDPDDRRLRQLLDITRTLMGFPRHLSQHSGGFVLTQDRLTSTVPVVPAAMPERSIIEWDKDDIDALGLMKVDVLALGMLSALRRMLDTVGAWSGRPLRLQDIPQDDVATYDMICRADTVGVFQIESRAQMSMLPRLRPRCFYDLVIEVAIVRPGPIQGGMVHPFLQRRELVRSGGQVDYPSPALEPALKRTLGVPIFQEQVMQIAVLAAGFTPGEADQLRRAMAAWRRKGGVDRFHHKVVQGMLANGYTAEFAEAIFRQIEGFGEYGFPESHAASFALLVYSSAWLKRHHPAAFLAALLNSQPMGFYSPSQLVQDALRHGVAVRPVDVCVSGWDSALEPGGDDPQQPAVRLGLSLVKGLPKAVAERIVEARTQAAPSDVQDLALRARLDAGDLKALAAADALARLAGHRRQQVWAASAQQAAPALLRGAPVHEAALTLPAAGEGEAVVHDYAALGLSLRRHPLALLRPQLAALRLMTAADLRDAPDGRLVRACGLVTTRQRPATAKGVVFVTLEDETGTVQVIVWKALRERQRAPLLQARLLAVYGRWQRTGEDDTHVVTHLIAQHLVDLTPQLGGLHSASRDFH